MAALSIACEGWSLALLGIAVVTFLERGWAAARPHSGTLILALAVLAIAFAFIAAISYGLKAALQTPRPPAVLGSGVAIVLPPAYVNGLPSGHAAASAMLATLLTAMYGHRAAWLWVLVALGGISRVYVGAHWVFDVVAGWGVGVATAALVLTTTRRFRVAPSPEVP